jgi:hypothetical protein
LIGAVLLAMGVAVTLGGATIAQQREIEGPPRRLSSLKIVAPPNGGIYLGQHHFAPGDIQTFERAIGHKVAMWSPYGVMSGQEWETQLRFFIDPAVRAWNEGYVVLGGAYEVTYSDRRPFKVDDLLRGRYDDDLRRLAVQYREFGRPLFFSAAREPNGSRWLGGFGQDGTQSLAWAIENGRGLADFDPSQFPNPSLYAGLGDQTVCDGLERLAAAHRYYYDFFVRREGLTFLTFDTMGWATPIVSRPIDAPPGTHAYRLREGCNDFTSFYPGDEYVDWVSLTWYLLDEEGDALVPIQDYLDNLSEMMRTVAAVAPDKPVLIVEFGAPQGLQQASTRATEKMRAALGALVSHPQIHGFVLWSNSPGYDDPQSPAYYPHDMLIKPNTGQAQEFRSLIETDPSRFHSCVYLSDGAILPNCVDRPGASTAGMGEEAGAERGQEEREQGARRPRRP